MKPQLILISGKLTSGKSTLAWKLEEEHGYERFALAGALKSDIEKLVGTAITPSNKGAFRGIFQEYGSLMKEIYGTDYWVERLTANMKDSIRQRMALFPFRKGATDGPRFVIDDVRYPYEIEGLRNFGDCITVRLCLLRDEQAKRHLALYGTLPDPEKLRHHSETALDDYQGFDLVFPENMPVESIVHHILALAAHKGGVCEVPA